MALTLLHFANLRLGTSFPTLGLRGRDQRAQLLSTLSTLGDLAVAEHVHAVLISGDLFDCAVPAPATLRAVQTFFAELRDKGIPAIVLPGGRDPASLFDPTRQPGGQDHFPGAILVDEYHPRVRLAALELTVHHVALPVDGSRAPRAVVIGTVPTIGLGYFPAGRHMDLEATASLLQGTGLSYLGVGGSLTFESCTSDGLVVCSPGVPEPLEWGQEEGSIALVRIEDDGSVFVERGRTGTRSLARRELVLTVESARNVLSLIAAMAHDDLSLEIVLRGECPGDVLIDPAAIETELGPTFFNLRVYDRTTLLIAPDDPMDVPKGTVLGNFVKVMHERIRKAASDDLAMYEREAYRLGMGLLQGEGG